MGLQSCNMKPLPLQILFLPSVISALSYKLPPPSLVSCRTYGFVHMTFRFPPSSFWLPSLSSSLSPTLPLHHPNALWQCRLLYLLLNGSTNSSASMNSLFLSINPHCLILQFSLVSLVALTLLLVKFYVCHLNVFAPETSICFVNRNWAWTMSSPSLAALSRVLLFRSVS